MGPVLAAVCWLLLDAPECRGHWKVLGSGDYRVVLLLETDVSGRKVAADIDAELGLVTCVLDSDRPDGQTVHPRAESHTGLV